METNCFLCDEKLQFIKYNLKSTKAKFSGNTLMTHIENVTGEISGTHLDICENCLVLINELDAIKLRVIEINSILREYIKIRYLSYQLATEKIEYNSQESETETNPYYLGSKVSVMDKNLSETIHDYETKMDCSIETLIKSEEVFVEQIEKVEPSWLKETVHSSSSETYSNVSVAAETNSLKPQRIQTPEPERDIDINNHLYMCEVCGRSYKHKRNLESHSKLHSGNSSFSCTYCDKSFAQKSDLIRHIPIHTGEKPHQCEKCGKRFTHHTSFNLHIKTHTGKKTHKCTMCDQGFTTTSHLKRHIRVHTGEKKFSCTRCGKRFAERYNLAAHEKLHNSKLKSKLKKFSCHICEESFERKHRLEEHQTKKHLSGVPI